MTQVNNTKPSRILFLTHGDGWSGVFAGQVVDVCKTLLRIERVDVQLISFQSIRHFRRQYKAICKVDPSARVLPMWPGTRRWHKNRYLLAYEISRRKPQALICRGPLATALAIDVRNSLKADYCICYDGRGARAAEIHEFYPNHPLADSIDDIERQAVLSSDYRISVSEQLAQFWRVEFGYEADEHVVIPCTLSESFSDSKVLQDGDALRANLGWPADEVVLAYSGSSDAWQYSPLLESSLRVWLARDAKLRILFLSKESPLIHRLRKEFPERIHVEWVSPSEVASWLAACDAGILMGEKSIRNRVASPVKFAEYLACGLQVICSEGIGDYSALVAPKRLGQVITEQTIDDLAVEPNDNAERERLRAYALKYFHKESPVQRKNYTQLLSRLLLAEDEKTVT